MMLAPRLRNSPQDESALPLERKPEISVVESNTVNSKKRRSTLELAVTALVYLYKIAKVIATVIITLHSGK